MMWHGRHTYRNFRILVIGALSLILTARHKGDWMRRWQLPLIALFLVGCAQTGASSGANATPAGTTATSPGFATGTLVTVSATTMHLTASGPDELRLVLAPNTQICRGSCAARGPICSPGIAWQQGSPMIWRGSWLLLIGGEGHCGESSR